MKEVTAVIAFEDEISLLEIVAYIEENYDAVISSADEWFWMDGWMHFA